MYDRVRDMLDREANLPYDIVFALVACLPFFELSPEEQAKLTEMLTKPARGVISCPFTDAECGTLLSVLSLWSTASPFSKVICRLAFTQCALRLLLK